ncbi:MAG: hypothetical protein ABIH59_00470 [archaeon]
MKKKKEKQSFFQKKSVVATFGIVALLGGFFFLNSTIIAPGVTGNIIINKHYQGFSYLSIIGFLLILCSAILVVYAIVKKK